MRCADRVWNIDYELFSGAVFANQLLFHPIMSGYDYFVKVDLDVDWIWPLPSSSLFEMMQAQQCVWMHSQHRDTMRTADCRHEAVELFASQHGTVPASRSQRWWGSLDYCWGNLIGG